MEDTEGGREAEKFTRPLPALALQQYLIYFACACKAFTHIFLNC